jgi:hypothetical protein
LTSQADPLLTAGIAPLRVHDQSGQQRIEGEGFGEIVANADGISCRYRIVISACGDQYLYAFGIFADDLSKKIEPVHPGQSVIADNDIKNLLLERPQTLLGGLGNPQRVAFLAEGQFHGMAYKRVIIDQQRL